MLQQNLLHLPNIEVSPKAVSNTTGKGIINEYPFNHSGRATLENMHWVKKGLQKSYEIQLTTLEKQCEDIKSRVGLIKIDVEGHELKVLQGAHKLLLLHKPALIFEYNSGDKEVLEFLERAGYTTFYVPTTELIMTFSTKLELIKYLKKVKNPIQTAIKLYASNSLIKFTRDTLPKCELVLTFHENPS
jgi:FkbM family methyltransferase